MDGCAVLWPVWGAIAEYAEEMALIKAGKAPPAYWTRNDWRMAHRIASRLERLAIEEAHEER